MFHTLVLVAVGAVIGWHVPQPAWAKPASDAIFNLLSKGKGLLLSKVSVPDAVVALLKLLKIMK